MIMTAIIFISVKENNTGQIYEIKRQEHISTLWFKDNIAQGLDSDIGLAARYTSCIVSAESACSNDLRYRNRIEGLKIKSERIL